MDKVLTLIIPYYNQPQMLAKQFEEIAQYPESIQVIVVDDGSQEHPLDAEGISFPSNVDVYRITEDIPWNRGQARNLGAYMCETDWLIQTDIDHILTKDSAICMVAAMDIANPLRWYRFRRFRVGVADETRKKDKIHHRKKFGEIKPHIDSYLIRRDMFFTSPYDERYSGCLGGGSPFLSRMTEIHGAPDILGDAIELHVHTRSSVPDSSVSELSRDREEYKKRRNKFADTPPQKILKYPWIKVN